MGNQLSKQNHALSDDEIKILVQAQIIPPNTPPAIIRVFSDVCKMHGLSPAKKEVFLLPYNVKVNTNGRDEWQVRYATIVGRDGLRLKAQRTGQLAGIDQPVYDDNKTIAMYKPGELPMSCTVTVYRFVSGQKCAFTSCVSFSEFSSGKQKWASMPFHMIAKVAECHALKMAFGEETSGLYVEEEMAAFQEVKEEIKAGEENEIAACLDRIYDLNSLLHYYKQLEGGNLMTPEVRFLFTTRKTLIQNGAIINA